MLNANSDDFPESVREGDAEASIPILPLAATVDDPIPALRELRARILNVGGEAKKTVGGEETVVVLEDPEGLAPKQAALSTWAYALATLFDGNRNAKEVAEDFAERFGQTVPVEQALDLQRELDKANFLYSERFEKSLKKQLQTYLEADIRPATLAGVSYPSDPKAAEEMIAGFFSGPEGPGKLDLDMFKKLEGNGTALTPAAMVIPHIELQKGGATYAYGYDALLRTSRAEVFFILGVAHKSPGEGLFYVSQKDFETPFGTLKTDKQIARRLQAAAGIRPELAELAHRTEFSVEFQAFLLSGLLSKGLNRDIQIVPIVCGSVESFLVDDSSPFGAPAFIEFSKALRKELEICKRPWCVLCSVDLSHVGPEFGHSTMMTERLLLPLERADKKFLKILEKMDATAAFAEIARTQNSRHVDAVMSVLMMLHACEGMLKSGKLLQYDQLLKDETHSAVTYASMMFR